jgi:hypothetical protein
MPYLANLVLNHGTLFFIVVTVCLLPCCVLGQADAPRCATGTPETLRKAMTMMRR